MNRRSAAKTIFLGSAGIIISPLSAFSNSFSYDSSLEELISGPFAEIKSFSDFNNSAIIIDGENQTLYYITEKEESIEVVKKYSVSTGKYGFGNNPNSGRTPSGIHKIIRKYGDNASEGAIFHNMSNTGRIAEITKEGQSKGPSLITSRILQLRGCEDKNSNTELRHIYIHGTSNEAGIGKPVSSGCIRMKNSEIIELYSLIPVGTYINIKEKIRI